MRLDDARIPRNAICPRCDGWVYGGLDEVDGDGNLIHDEFGNRIRQMACGHVLHPEEPDLSITIEEDEPDW
jgi:hypothetical protein